MMEMKQQRLDGSQSSIDQEFEWKKRELDARMANLKNLKENNDRKMQEIEIEKHAIQIELLKNKEEKCKMLEQVEKNKCQIEAINTQLQQLAQSKIEKNVVDVNSLHSDSQDFDDNLFLMQLVTIFLHLDNPPCW